MEQKIVVSVKSRIIYNLYCLGFKLQAMGRNEMDGEMEEKWWISSSCDERFFWFGTEDFERVNTLLGIVMYTRKRRKFETLYRVCVGVDFWNHSNLVLFLWLWWCKWALVRFGAGCKWFRLVLVLAPTKRSLVGVLLSRPQRLIAIKRSRGS